MVLQQSRFVLVISDTPVAMKYFTFNGVTKHVHFITLKEGIQLNQQIPGFGAGLGGSWFSSIFVRRSIRKSFV